MISDKCKIPLVRANNNLIPRPQLWPGQRTARARARPALVDVLSRAPYSHGRQRERRRPCLQTALECPGLCLSAAAQRRRTEQAFQLMYCGIRKPEGKHPKQKATSKSAKSSAGNKRISFFINLVALTETPSINNTCSGKVLLAPNNRNKVPVLFLKESARPFMGINTSLLKKNFDVVINNKSFG